MLTEPVDRACERRRVAAPVPARRGEPFGFRIVLPHERDASPRRLDGAATGGFVKQLYFLREAADG